MKKLLYIFMATAMISGCKKPDSPGTDNPPPTPEPPVAEETLAEKIAGEWHCSASDMEADIYVHFTEEGEFELYQQITAGAYRLYRGGWEVADEDSGIITGEYNDGEKWGSDYCADISKDESSMTLTPVEGDDQVQNTYVRTEIPSDVKENCIVVVKSPYAY